MGNLSASASCVDVAPARRRSHPGPELEGCQLHAALPLGALPTAPGCGRAWTRQVLREWGLDRLADDTELLVSELTTNALQASAPIADAAIGLWLASDCERAVILVWDPSPQPPAAAKPGQDAEDGRGLLLVEALSLQWGWYFPASTSPGGHAGKVVWAIVG
jgi:anti-sigma regulatory factor (Ser/Thr protein kinase)